LLDSEKAKRLKTIRQEYFVILSCLGKYGNSDILRLNLIDKFKNLIIQSFDMLKKWLLPLSPQSQFI